MRFAADLNGSETGLELVSAALLDELFGVPDISLGPDHATLGAELGPRAEIEDHGGAHAPKEALPGFIGAEAKRSLALHDASQNMGASAERAWCL